MTEVIKVENVKVEIPMNASKRVYKELLKIVGNINISRSNIVVILLSLMQFVETYDGFSGTEKKNLILNALIQFIEIQIESPREKMEMQLLVQITLPTVIDTFVSIDKKKIKIKLKEIKVKLKKSLLACCK